MTVLELLPILALQLVLTGLPGAAAVVLGVHCGVRNAPILLAIGLAASGAMAMLTFWAFYADPVAGGALAYLLVLGSAFAVAWSLRAGRIEGTLLRQLATPVALWALGSAFILFLGFAHGGVESPLATAATRFSGQLPTDNDIPAFFADWFFHNGHAGTAPEFPGEWLSSDRPPLQIGYVLTRRPFGWDETGLRYQVLGVALQQLWIVGLWALLLAARVGRVTRALVMLTALASNLVIVNSFFVWPKLLPAAMLLAAAALVATPLWPSVRRSLWGALLVGALLALAMLGHGSSVFGIAGLLAIAAYRGLPNWRWVAVGLGIGVVLLGSWTAYQRYGDPPGNRLAKWFGAGVVDIDDRGVTEAMVDSYADAGIGGTLSNKAYNFETMTGGAAAWRDISTAADEAVSGRYANAIRGMRAVFFFYLLPSLGLLLIAPLAMIAARWRGRAADSADWRLALSCYAIFAAGAVSWGLLIFGGSAATTTIHQGSYLIPLIGIAGAVAGLRAATPRLAIWMLAVNALFLLALYAPALDPPDGSSYSAVAAVLAVASLAGFGAALAHPVSE